MRSRPSGSVSPKGRRKPEMAWHPRSIPDVKSMRSIGRKKKELFGKQIVYLLTTKNTEASFATSFLYQNCNSELVYLRLVEIIQ